MAFNINGSTAINDSRVGILRTATPGYISTESNLPTATPAGAVYYINNYKGQGPKFVYANNNSEWI